ncbi:MAG: signal peptide peptidase SppA [bacterium]|nr:signal peptide peptidase SppA [Candidatus Sumerlaeota bacterium]
MSTDTQKSPPPHHHAPRRGYGCLRFLLYVILAAAALVIIGNFTGTTGSLNLVLSPSVGVIHIEGPINESGDIVEILGGMEHSKQIKAVVVRIDSPGGFVGASEEIYRAALRIRTASKKPVIVSMGNVAASGGYYIAVAGDEIFANAGTVTGSIGVLAFDLNVREALEKLGIRPQVFKSGEFKDTMSSFRDITPQDRQLVQGMVLNLYRQFFRVVLRSRHGKIGQAMAARPSEIAEIVAAPSIKPENQLPLSEEVFTTSSMAAEAGASVESENTLRAVADGRVLTGEQALKLGLVDRIGGLEDAIEFAGEMAGLGKRPHVVERRPSSAIPVFLGMQLRQFWKEFTRNETMVEYRGAP